MNIKKIGDWGEKLACEYLVDKGYNILVKNYRISFGEIDIIARKRKKFLFWGDKTIHFVEVKTIISENDHFFPEDRVDYKKQKKIRQLVEIWLEKNNYSQNYPCQIDVIGIKVSADFKNSKIHYFSNIVEDF